MMTTDDIDLVKAFRIHLCDFNIMHIFGSASYDNTVLALSFIRNDYQFLHIGTKYGQLLAYDTNTNVNDDNIWFKGLMNRKLCNETYSDMCEKQNIFLKYPNVRLNKNHNMFEVLLSINDIDVLHIAKWIMHYTNKYDDIYLHQLSNLHMYSIPAKSEYMQRFWTKDYTPEKIFIEHDLNI